MKFYHVLSLHEMTFTFLFLIFFLSFFFSVSPESNSRNGNDGLDTLETIPEAVPVEFTEPPIEEQLACHTLWPESHKLYGHGNELYSLCCDHGGKLIASSCKVCHIADWWCLCE